MTDIISIRGLSLSAVIGAYDWEREIEQTLVGRTPCAPQVTKSSMSLLIAAHERALAWFGRSA